MNVMQTVGVLQVMPRFPGTVMGTSTHQDRSLECWKTPAKGTVSMLVVLMVRVLKVMHHVMVRLMMPMVTVLWVMHFMHWLMVPLVVPMVRVH